MISTGLAGAEHQLDRFSAPIENRYSRSEVAAWFERAGLKDVVILGGAGWRASGKRVGQTEIMEAEADDEKFAAETSRR